MVLWVSIGIDSSGKKQMIIANSPATIEYIVFLTLSMAAPSAVSKSRGVGAHWAPPGLGGWHLTPIWMFFFWRKNKGDGVCHTQNSQLRIPKREGGEGGGVKNRDFSKKKTSTLGSSVTHNSCNIRPMLVSLFSETANALECNSPSIWSTPMQWIRIKTNFSQFSRVELKLSIFL